jgi:hypothetical protein
MCRLRESLVCVREREREKKEIKSRNKTTGFRFPSCVEVFLGDTVDLWVKDLGYIYCNMITNSTNVYCDGTCVATGEL